MAGFWRSASSRTNTASQTGPPRPSLLSLRNPVRAVPGAARPLSEPLYDPRQAAQTYGRPTALLGALRASHGDARPYLLMVGQLVSVAFGWPLRRSDARRDTLLRRVCFRRRLPVGRSDQRFPVRPDVPRLCGRSRL